MSSDIKQMNIPVELASVPVFEFILSKLQKDKSEENRSYEQIAFNLSVFLQNFLASSNRGLNSDTKVIELFEGQKMVRVEHNGSKHVYSVQQINVNNPNHSAKNDKNSGWSLNYVMDKDGNTIYIGVTQGCGCKNKKSEANE